MKAFNYYDNGIEFLCVKDRLHLKDHFTKVVAGKQLWNYDNLEPTEKKLIL